MNLKEELLTISGISAAELDGDANTPAGVRIRLAPGADADAVGREVQRVLAEHGMRSHMTAPSLSGPPIGVPEAVAPPEPSVPEERRVEPAAVVVSTTTGDAPPPPPGALRAAVGAEVVQLPGVATDPDPAAVASSSPESAERLASVGVEETRTGVTVRVSTELGRHVERSVSTAGPLVDVAIVEAVGELLASPAPAVVAVNDHVVDGTDVILVVVEHAAGSRTAGCAVMAAGRPFAVGTAAWRAVSAQV